MMVWHCRWLQLTAFSDPICRINSKAVAVIRSLQEEPFLSSFTNCSLEITACCLKPVSTCLLALFYFRMKRIIEECKTHAMCCCLWPAARISLSPHWWLWISFSCVSRSTQKRCVTPSACLNCAWSRVTSPYTAKRWCACLRERTAKAPCTTCCSRWRRIYPRWKSCVHESL